MNNQEYEFSPQDNQIIGRTALWARVLGAVLCLQGIAKLMDFPQSPFGTILNVVVSVAIGASFFLGGSSLQRVVDTEGCDVPHLMEALRQLTRAFTIRIALVAIAVGFFALAFFAAIAMS